MGVCLSTSEVSDVSERFWFCELRVTREEAGLSQTKLAAVFRLKRTAITNIECGLWMVDALGLKRPAKLYGRPITYFIGNDRCDEAWSHSEVAKPASTVKAWSVVYDQDRSGCVGMRQHDVTAICCR